MIDNISVLYVLLGRYEVNIPKEGVSASCTCISRCCAHYAQNGIAYGDQMQFNNYTHQVHDNGSKTNSNRRDQPVSIRMKGKSTKNLSS